MEAIGQLCGATVALTNGDARVARDRRCALICGASFFAVLAVVTYPLWLTVQRRKT